MLQIIYTTGFYLVKRLNFLMLCVRLLNHLTAKTVV